MRQARAPARLFIRSAVLALALAAGEGAHASCLSNVPGQHVFAQGGDSCLASGAYNPTATSGILPFPDNGFGLVAFGGGAISDLSAVSVTTTGVFGSYAAWSQGAASQISLSFPATISTSGASSYGFYASNGGMITANLGSILTSGLEAGGVLSASGVVVVLSGGSILTTGDGAAGLTAIPGSSISATGTAITTQGNEDVSGIQADGVFVAGTGARATLTNDKIVTLGTLSHGVYATSGGVASIIGGSINVSGTDADGLLADGAGSKISTSGGTTIVSSASPSTFVIDGARVDHSAVLNLTNTSVSTSGAGTSGVGAYGGGTATLSGGSVATSGVSALGFQASGAGSSISTSNGTTITTKGADSPGAQADTGGAVTLNGGSVTTSGIGSKGLYVTSVGSTIAATNVAVTTNGGFDLSTGSSANGVFASNGGSATSTGGSINTTGNGAYAAVANNGAVIKLAGTTIGTTGAGSGGLGINGTGSEIDATGVSIATNGGLDPVTGLHSYGVYNGPYGSFAAGGLANLTGSTIATSGAQMFGVTTSTGGATTISGGSITTAGLGASGVVTQNGGSTSLSGVGVTTSGQDAHALFVTGSGSQASLSGANVLTTGGDGAIGLYATRGGHVTATGSTTITTSGTNSISTGLSAFGVNADGAGSQISLAATTITTAGQGAVGLYASDVGATGSGGAITISGPLSVTTGTAPFSYGAWSQNVGSTIALNGPSAFTIDGGAFALYATLGGSISSANTLGVVVNGSTGGGVEVDNAGSMATLMGATSIALNGSNDAGLFATSGGAISAQGPTTIAVSGANSVGVAALSGSVTASGALNVTTSQASSAAFALSGASPSILATGGGTVSTAADAIVFSSATSAAATFDNFKFSNASGDLIFAYPSIATVNFNSTVANAGTNNVLNATSGSVVTLNASASTLTGAIQTDSTSTSNVNLTNGTTWTMTGSSVASNLNVVNGAILFAPPAVGGGFKTLTVSGAYVGTGASLTLNTALGGSNSPTDQVIVNGGSATGLTSLTIKNAGGSGAQTTGAGIPVVVVTSGGTTAPNAFQLASTPVVGGFEYSLSRDPANQDWYLTSAPVATTSDLQSSVTQLAKSRQNQMITTRLLASLLLGANEQVNCSSCAGGFGSIGSFALGAHTRWALSDRLTLLGGASYNKYSVDNVEVSGAPIVAASLRYDLADWGRSRPFAELGGALSPYETVTYTRVYANGAGLGSGKGSTIDREVSIFGRLGWVARFTPIDEGAVFVDLVRSWQQVGGYTELASFANPFPATVSQGVDTQNVVRFGAQYTHLFSGRIEANVNAAFAHSFDSNFGSQVNVLDFGAISPYPLGSSGWAEFGARLGYRFTPNFIVDAFVIGTIGGEPGRTAHGGLGVRYAF